MGKGDKKSKRGKIFNGTFGVRRPHGHSAVQPSVHEHSGTATVAQEAPLSRPAAGAKKKS
jgi:ribosomal small subunit protein bTHX